MPNITHYYYYKFQKLHRIGSYFGHIECFFRMGPRHFIQYLLLVVSNQEMDIHGVFQI